MYLGGFYIHIYIYIIFYYYCVILHCARSRTQVVTLSVTKKSRRPQKKNEYLYTECVAHAQHI